MLKKPITESHAIEGKNVKRNNNEKPMLGVILSFEFVDSPTCLLLISLFSILNTQDIDLMVLIAKHIKFMFAAKYVRS